MNLNSLRYIVEVSREGNMTAAAKKLYLSQSSLSQSIRSEENRLGTPLFDRSSLPLKLTLAGELYVEWAMNVLASEENFTRRITDMSENCVSRLSLGASPHRCSRFLPDIIHRFHQKYKNCVISIVEKPTSELMSVLESGKVDLLIDVANPDGDRYTSIDLTTERILLGVPSKYALQGIPSSPYPLLELSLVKDLPFILMNERQRLGEISRAACFASGFVPNVIIECLSIDTATQLASLGMGVVFLPGLLVKHDSRLKNIDTFTIDKLFPSRKVSVLYKNDRFLSKAAMSFIDMLRDYFNEDPSLA